MNGMQAEIDQLRVNVADMKKNMGFDDELFDDLNDFDKKVSELIFLFFPTPQHQAESSSSAREKSFSLMNFPCHRSSFSLGFHTYRV